MLGADLFNHVLNPSVIMLKDTASITFVSLSNDAQHNNKNSALSINKTPHNNIQHSVS
jgi:hypothetical protein